MARITAHHLRCYVDFLGLDAEDGFDGDGDGNGDGNGLAERNDMDN
jgi:hypothetical protein